MRQSGKIVQKCRPLVLLAVVIALGACDGDRTDAREDAETGAADGAEAVAPAIEANAPVDVPDAVSSTELPEWFPEDAYLPAGYSVAEVNEDFGARQVELRVDGDIGEVAAQARAGMLAAGWTETHFSAPDGTRGSNMHFTSDTRGATLSMSTAGDGSVRVVYGFTLPEPAAQ